jgi:hypothetical protein
MKMARTHQLPAEYGDGGIVLGKGGEPIPTTPTRGVPTLNPHGAPVQHMDDGEIVPAPPKPEPAAPVEYEYYCDRTTWQRNMDGWQALQLLGLMLGGLSCVLSQEDFSRVPADCRWHMKRRVKAPVEAPE